tara:strand:- start:720 stop:1376 length:657 start_codon:yes stop_codon:yes gene_type:complete
MSYPIAPKHMFNYRSSIIKNFGYDTKTAVEYRFNDLGYRSDIEFIVGQKPVIILGNTISFGLGVDIKDTFTNMLASHLKKPVYNFSWGCYAHTNYEQLQLLRSIIETDNPSLIIFQINNLNRYRKNNTVCFDNPTELIIKEYEKFYTEISKLLKNKRHIFLHWDNQEHNVNLPNCLIKNRFLIDCNINIEDRTVGGIKSHKLIGLKIIKEIEEQKIYE